MRALVEVNYTMIKNDVKKVDLEKVEEVMKQGVMKQGVMIYHRNKNNCSYNLEKVVVE